MREEIISVNICVTPRVTYPPYPRGYVMINRANHTTGYPGENRFYYLTERNYWRAVGMQLRLAGFANDAGENPLDKKNYREEE